MPQSNSSWPDRSRRYQQNRTIRYWQRHTHLYDAGAFAYMRGWPLEIRPTIAWDAALASKRRDGHILALPDKDRNAALRCEIGRIL